MRKSVTKHHPGRLRARYGVLLALAAAVVAAVAASSGSASGPSSAVKNYDACLQQGTTSSLPGNPTDTGCSTSSLPGNSITQVTLRISNEQGSNTTIGSLNLDAPGGFAFQYDSAHQPSIVDAANTTQTAAGVVGSGSTAGQLQLRYLAVTPNNGVDVTFWVFVPCQPTSFGWKIATKQSNTFNGTGNDFNLISSSSSGFTSGVAAGTASQVVFTTQPSPSPVKTGSTFSTAVSVEDSCGNSTGGGGSLLLSLNQPTEPVSGGGGTLTGGDSVTATSPTVFNNLSVSAPGIGYTLTATFRPTSGSPITADSAPIDVLDFVTDCASACSGDTTDTTSTDLNVAAPDTNGLLGLSLAGAAPAGTTCTLLDGSQATLTPLGKSYMVIPPTRTDPSKDYYNIKVTITLLKRALQGVGVSNIKVCKNQLDKSTTSATVIMKQVPPCPSPAKKWLTAPQGAPNACIVSQTSDNAGDAVITMLINSVDPHGFTGG